MHRMSMVGLSSIRSCAVQSMHQKSTWLEDYWISALHEHRKQVLTLRCLATKKGRATTTDPVMNFLEQLGDNGVIWKVLSFWPPPP